MSASEVRVKELVSRLLEKAKDPSADRVVGDKAIELVEELLVRRFTKLSREEIRTMFPLADIRDTRVAQEFYQDGQIDGMEKMKKELVHKWLAKGKSPKDIAELLEISEPEVQQLADNCRQ